jgi:hypothetical protein
VGLIGRENALITGRRPCDERSYSARSTLWKNAKALFETGDAHGDAQACVHAVDWVIKGPVIKNNRVIKCSEGFLFYLADYKVVVVELFY